MHNRNRQMLMRHKVDFFACSFRLHTVVLILLFLVKLNSLPWVSHHAR